MAAIALLVRHRGNRQLLHDALGHHHRLIGEAELDLWRHPPELILADPQGFGAWEAALRQYRAAWAPALIPVLLMVSPDEAQQALGRLGDTVDDLVYKPLRKQELAARIQNLLRLQALSSDLNSQLTERDRYSRTLEQEVSERTGQLKRTLGEISHRLTRASEFKDADTGRHIARVCHHARQLAEQIGCSREFSDLIFEAAALHDVGKIAVPDYVLHKAGPLDDEEWAIMKRHTVDGERLLAGSESPYLQLGAEIARSHHERYDGSGYPDGLAGEAIPLSARILQLADVYDALRMSRPYKAGFDHETAMRIILEGDSRSQPEHFDPRLLKAFERHADAFAEIQETLADR
ncbi:MAG: HD-GYP domain-containing protein [Halorhodospira sp.]